MRRPRAAAALACALLASGCSFAPDLRTCAGRPRCDRETFVAARAEAPAVRVKDGPAALEELLLLVEGGSVPLYQVRAQVAASGAAVSAARADLLPNLAFAVSGLGYAKAPGSLGFTTDRHNILGTIDLTIPLDISWRLAESVRAAQARYRSEEHRLLAEARAERLLVAQAYFDLLEAIDLAEVNEAAVKLQERALRDGQARFDVGVLRKNDVLVIEVALSNSRQRAVALQSTIQEARRGLNAATGLPIARVTEVLPFPALIPVDPDPVPLLDRARRDNPEVDVLVETRTALLHDICAKGKENLPEVDIGPRLIATSDSTTEPNQNFLGFLSARWNPDLNGKISAEQRGLKAQLLGVTWEVTGLLRKLEADILRVHRDTIEKTSALRAAESSVGQARENLRILFEQFRAGIATGREVLEAEALLTQQLGTLRSARHAVNRAQFELRNLAGVDPLDYAREVSVLPPESRPESAPESR